MQSIPKLDLSHFTHGSDSQKHNFVNELGYAYEHIGFVAIRNHGIPNEVLTDLYREPISTPTPTKHTQRLKIKQVK